MTSVEGLDELQKVLGDAASGVRPAVHREVKAAGQRVREDASQRAPSVLRTKVTFTKQQKVAANEDSVGVETRGVLGTIMEFGAPTLPGGRPFMGPALRAEDPVFVKAVDDAIGGLLR